MPSRSMRDSMQMRPMMGAPAPMEPTFKPTIAPSVAPPAKRLPMMKPGMVAPQTVGGTPPTANVIAAGHQAIQNQATAPRVVATQPGPMGRVPVTPPGVLSR
jgi:hypothetical protein